MKAYPLEALDESLSFSSISSLKINTSVSNLPPDSDYNTDETHVFVEERSMEVFELINEILCMMAQTGYDEMINKGYYKAQINAKRCRADYDDVPSKDQSSQNQSSNSNKPRYEIWTVNSYRVDENSPHIVEVWVHQEAKDWEPPMTIEVKVTITEAMSESNPYGLFHMNFKGLMKWWFIKEVFHGFFRTDQAADGTILLQFYNDGSFYEKGGKATFTESITVNRAPDGSFGSGSVYSDETSPYENWSESFDIAFDDDYFFRRDDSNDHICFDRKQFDGTAYRYNLYYDENAPNPGKRVTRNSGFSIQYVADDGTCRYGWAGYGGIWLPDDVEISSGDTVYKRECNHDYDDDYDDFKEKEYNAFIVDGKLSKRTKRTITLGEIAGIPLSHHRCVDGSGDSCMQYRVEWDSADQKLYVTGWTDENDWIWQDIDQEELTFGEDDWSFHFWSNSLNGDGQVQLKDSDTGQWMTLGNDTEVIFHTHKTVHPYDSDIPSDLACFYSCLDPDRLEDEDPYFPRSRWETEDSFASKAQEVPPESLEEGVHYAGYTFDKDSMVLEHDGKEVTTRYGDDDDHIGIWELIELDDLDQLACDWDWGWGPENGTCPWQAYEKLDTFYSWDTGPNDWNRLFLLQDPVTDAFLQFEPPLKVEYARTNGTKYYLDYSGHGELHGIQGKCVDMDTGEDTECDNDCNGDHRIRWVPKFSIADGTKVKDTSGSASYYVKALEREQRMKAVDADTCISAGLTLTSYALPDDSLWEEPDIGDEPEIDGPPAVIGGVVQED